MKTLAVTTYQAPIQRKFVPEKGLKIKVTNHTVESAEIWFTFSSMGCASAGAPLARVNAAAVSAAR